jgi:hypothetical protein
MNAFWRIVVGHENDSHFFYTHFICLSRLLVIVKRSKSKYDAPKITAKNYKTFCDEMQRQV